MSSQAHDWSTISLSQRPVDDVSLLYALFFSALDQLDKCSTNLPNPLTHCTLIRFPHYSFIFYMFFVAKPASSIPAAIHAVAFPSLPDPNGCELLRRQAGSPSGSNSAFPATAQFRRTLVEPFLTNVSHRRKGPPPSRVPRIPSRQTATTRDVTWRPALFLNLPFSGQH